MRPTLGANRLHGISSNLCLRCRVQAQRHFTTAQPSNAARTMRIGAARPEMSALRLCRQLSSTATTLASPAQRPSPSATTTTTTTTNPPTYYDLFPETLPQGPPPNGPFPIDTRALRREFLRLQASQHPDLHHHRSGGGGGGSGSTSTGSGRNRSSAAAAINDASAAINEAYRTLSNPLLRAQYILSLRGVDVAADETLKVEEPGLLMLVLEAREEIEDAQEESDLDAPREANEARIAEGEVALDEAFARDDLEAAKREAVRMRYWVNIRDSLNNWEKGKPIVLEH